MDNTIDQNIEEGIISIAEMLQDSVILPIVLINRIVILLSSLIIIIVINRDVKDENIFIKMKTLMRIHLK